MSLTLSVVFWLQGVSKVSTLRVFLLTADLVLRLAHLTIAGSIANDWRSASIIMLIIGVICLPSACYIVLLLRFYGVFWPVGQFVVPACLLEVPRRLHITA